MAPGCALAAVRATSRCARIRSSAGAGNVECSSMSARMSSVGANLPVVETKPIEPDSLPIPTLTDVPSSCSAFDSASPSRVVVPSLSIDAVMLARPRWSAVSNWSAPPENEHRERHQRQVVLLGDDQLRAVRERRLRPRRHPELRRLPGRRDLRPVQRLPGAKRQRRHEGHREDDDRQRVESGRSSLHLRPGRVFGASDFLALRRLRRPRRACRSARRSARSAPASGTCRRPASRRRR